MAKGWFADITILIYLIVVAGDGTILTHETTEIVTLTTTTGIFTGLVARTFVFCLLKFFGYLEGATDTRSMKVTTLENATTPARTGGIIEV